MSEKKCSLCSNVFVGKFIQKKEIIICVDCVFEIQNALFEVKDTGELQEKT